MCNSHWKSILIAFVLFDFAALTGYSIYAVGYVGIFYAGTANWGAIQIFVDLVIACGLACVWMAVDARRRHVNPWPFIVVTLFMGTFGPLLYLLRREWTASAVAAQPA